MNANVHHYSKEEKELKLVLTVGIIVIGGLSMVAAVLHVESAGHAATVLGIALNIRWVWS